MRNELKQFMVNKPNKKRYSYGNIAMEVKRALRSDKIRYLEEMTSDVVNGAGLNNMRSNTKLSAGYPTRHPATPKVSKVKTKDIATNPPEITISY